MRLRWIGLVWLGLLCACATTRTGPSTSTMSGIAEVGSTVRVRVPQLGEGLVVYITTPSRPLERDAEVQVEVRNGDGALLGLTSTSQYIPWTWLEWNQANASSSRTVRCRLAEGDSPADCRWELEVRRH